MPKLDLHEGDLPLRGGQKGRTLLLMREVYSSADVTEVSYYKSLLDQAEIASYIQNENATAIGLAGAMFFPRLCIIDDDDYNEALHVLKSRQFQGASELDEWTCSACSEKNPGNFELCWKCGKPKPI
jgi:hypothetical protein